MPKQIRCPYCGNPFTSDASVKRHISHTPKCQNAWLKTLEDEPMMIRQPPMGVESVNTDFAMEDDIIFIPDVPPAPQGPDHRRWTDPYPGLVATTHGTCKTTFELWRDEAKISKNKHKPFDDGDEWGLASWLFRNVTQGGIDDYLKLPHVRKRGKVSFHSKHTFLKKIDQLPTGPQWTCELISLTGDQTGPGGSPMVEELELWRRDPVECIRELVGNPLFKDSMAYEPEMVYENTEATIRMVDETWTGDWWQETQAKIPAGGVVVPVILATDKTKLTQLGGDKTAWPVYLSIGNISKEMRRQVSASASILIGYLPVSKLEIFQPATRSLSGYRLFHHCMTMLLKPLVSAGKDGVLMTCADSYVRKMFPILAAYLADYPEQCLVACCMENRCPTCGVEAKRRGEPLHAELRTVEETLALLNQHREKMLHGGTHNPRFDTLGIRPVYHPFWRDLPHCNIFSCWTPDLLHQIHKGLFKDHLVQWCSTIIGDDELDHRFRAVPPFPGLRHFKKGISGVSQWTGKEQREMERIFVAIMAGSAVDDVITIVRAIVDFAYYATFNSHTDDTLASLQRCLDVLHMKKKILVDLGIRENFNIPKFHNVQHYKTYILAMGTADGYTTELPERLHIDFAKNAYRSSNRRDYTIQMTLWLQRQEALILRERFLEWLRFAPCEDDEQDEGPDTELLEDDVETDGKCSEDSSDDSDSLSDDEPDQFSQHNTTYYLPKHPSRSNLSISQLETVFGAVDFVPALSRWLSRNFPLAPVISLHDTFNIYRKVVTTLPFNPRVALSQQPLKSTIRVRPAQPANGRKPATPAEFSTVLVMQDRDAFDGSLEGLQVAQVRLIFSLPSHFGLGTPTLAYVEWFTPFKNPDPITGMHEIRRSTRNLRRNASVIPVHDLVRACHLVSKCGRKMSTSWEHTAILDQAPSFWLNHYIDIDMFCRVRCAPPP